MSVMTYADAEVDQSARERRMRDLFLANEAPLRRYLERLSPGRPETAEDNLQETMLRAWRSLDQVPEDAESVRRWLFRVARNVTIDGVRSRMARPPEVYSTTGEWTVAVAVENETNRVLDREVLREALAELPELHRKVLVLLYCHDVSVAEAAAMLDIPTGTVRSRSFYALRKVRDSLSRADDEPPR